MSIETHLLTKRYGATTVVDEVSLQVASGELFVLLGPSGSGKSTLLRMIAGLATVDEGSVLLHGRDVTGVSPKDRGIGFVFQHYALFRHMTVADNVEFALRIRKVPAARRRERREELLQLVGLAGFGDRYPRQLSGGQQQRVALARALAHEPSVLLLDEPFGALDAKIRLDLRLALRRIQRAVGLTTVFVTHDQDEAFELADRLAVLHDGRLLEAGEPRELYLRPRSPFVATFLGAANLVVGESAPQGVRLGDVELPLGSKVDDGLRPRRLQVLFRPEDVELSSRERGEHPRLGRGRVEQTSFIGAHERLRLRLPAPARVRGIAPAMSWEGSELLVEAVRPQHEAAALPLAAGDEAWVAVRRIHVLASAGLHLLLAAGQGPAAAPAREFAAALAERIGADVAPAGGTGGRVAGSPARGTETPGGAEAYEIVVLGRPGGRGSTVEIDPRWARHHLLFVSAAAPVPRRILVCVAGGEPGKGDVQFAERLAWQLGAAATVLTVLPESGEGAEVPAHVERFLDSSVRTLAARGVAAESRVRRGTVEAAIRAEVAEGGHELLVLGAPLPSAVDRPTATLGGVVERLVRQPPACPVLVVRYQPGD